MWRFSRSALVTLAVIVQQQMKTLLTTSEIQSGTLWTRTQSSTCGELWTKYWRVCATLSNRAIGHLNKNKWVRLEIHLQSWIHTLTAASPGLMQCWKLLHTVDTVCKPAHCDWTEQRTVVKNNRSNEHTVMHKRTTWITKRKTKGYLPTFVREPIKLWRPGITYYVKRLPHTTLKLCHAKLTKLQNKDIADTNPIHS